MELIFATQNDNKTREVSEILGESIHLVNLHNLGMHEDIPENEETLEGNAAAKARYVYDRFGKPCFADDTGLEVDALGGLPGVHSARYAGEQKDSDANVRKLLEKLDGIAIRSARFRTVIALIINDIEIFFEGRAEGVIAEAPAGESGFGYDPVFIPLGYDKTFAQMPPDEKNAMSHRGIAVNKFANYVNNLKAQL